MTPLDFLFSLERLGMKFGLESMRKICAALDHPEESFRSVIVAGTNGKGSVAAMTSAGLHAAGRTSARYTSPHLERLEERFVIGEREVDTPALEAAAATVQHTVERLMAEGILEALPTFFECSTAIAFELFRRASVDSAVIEVGLGGRLDATNVITPVAAAITSIDFDHQELLGNTLPEIAREKAGVVKPGIPVFAGPVAKDAERVIQEVCRERGARYVRALDRVRVSDVHTSDRTCVTLDSESIHLEQVALALPGRHQADNAAVAVCVMEALGLSETSIRDGLTRARWPARLETFRWCGTEILLDAAHNPAGARALADYLRDRRWTDVTLVFAAMRDKSVAGMLTPLMPFVRTIVCTTPPNPRAVPADSLAALASSLPLLPSMPGRVVAVPDPRAALDEACRAGRRIVIAGSIFLVGPLRGILR